MFTYLERIQKVITNLENVVIHLSPRRKKECKKKPHEIV